MPESDKSQLDRFKKAAGEAEADMSKDEFARVIGGLAKPTPPAPAEEAVPDTRVEKERK